MIKYIAAIGLALGLMSGAHAGSVTYSFSGFFYDIRGDGAGFSFGERFSVTYAHDDSSQLGSLVEDNRKVYRGGYLSAVAGGRSFNGLPDSELQVFNDWTNAIGGYNQDDGFFVSTWDYEAGKPDIFLLQFDIWDFSGETLSSLDIPSHSEFLALASKGGRFWVRRFQQGVETGLSQGGFVGMSPVPNPATIALLCLGLVGIGAARRKQVWSGIPGRLV